VLTVAALVLVFGAAPSQAAAPLASDRFVATELPDSQVGRQMGWLIEASARLPLSDAELRAHFTKAFLDSPGASPAEINQILGMLVDANGLRLLGLIIVEPTALVAIVTGRDAQQLVLTFAIDATGLVAGATIDPAAGGSEVTLPEPSGRAAVGTDVVQLVDRARGGRRLMLTRWYPAATGARGGGLASYASPRLTAALGLPPVRVHARNRARARRGRLPVVLFSPGLGVSRVVYQALGEDLASHGYLVLAVDHTREALVEFPDGRFAFASVTPSKDPIASVSATRVRDLRLILHSLSTMPKGPLPDRRRIAAMGHSLGGSTAAALMRVEPTVRAGIDLDGTIVGAAARSGIRRPFLALTAAGHWAHDPSLRRFFSHSRGPRLALEVAGFDHFSFSDMPVIGPGSPGVGKRPSARDISLQTTYVRAFLDRYLRDRPSRLLDRPSRRFPRVSFKYCAGRHLQIGGSSCA
jgi:dienelactone hydrolase